MPLLPGYSHYFLARHFAQERLRARLHARSEAGTAAKPVAEPDERDFRSGLALVLILICVPLIVVTMLALLGR